MWQASLYIGWGSFAHHLEVRAVPSDPKPGSYQLGRKVRTVTHSRADHHALYVEIHYRIMNINCG